MTALTNALGFEATKKHKSGVVILVSQSVREKDRFVTRQKEQGWDSLLRL